MLLQSTKAAGPAVAQYFQFVKHLAVVFAVMTVLSIPSYNLLSEGNGVASMLSNGLCVLGVRHQHLFRPQTSCVWCRYGDGDEIGWASVTPANVRETSIERDVAGDVVSLNTTFTVGGKSGAEVAASLATMDVLCAFAFLVYITCMRFSTYKLDKEIEADLISTRRFVVQHCDAIVTRRTPT